MVGFIKDEVEAQLNSTRSQAAKAAKYREVSVGLKQWWHGLAADDFIVGSGLGEIIRGGSGASSVTVTHAAMNTAISRYIASNDIQSARISPPPPASSMPMR